ASFSIFTPKFPNSLISLLTSIISGILVIVTFSGVKSTAHNICNASFFAPWGVISPFNCIPPSILNVPMLRFRCFLGYFLFLVFWFLVLLLLYPFFLLFLL